MKYLNCDLFSLYTIIICVKGSDNFGSIAGTWVDNFLRASTWEGFFNSQYWKGHKFLTKIENKLKFLEVVYIFFLITVKNWKKIEIRYMKLWYFEVCLIFVQNAEDSQILVEESKIGPLCNLHGISGHEWRKVKSNLLEVLKDLLTFWYCGYKRYVLLIIQEKLFFMDVFEEP